MSPVDRSDFFKVLPGEELPIFSGKLDDLTLFYAPGYLAAAREKEAEEICQILSGEIPFGNLIAADLINAAASARSRRAVQQDPAYYQPTCLTLYTSLSCNLACCYCFAEKAHAPNLILPENLIREAAQEVLKNCAAQGVPFTAVFHGGGEPTQDPRLREILTDLRRMSEENGVPFHSYIAANGVMSEEMAHWVAENFDEVGLSVDGPPEIQNAQRPLRQGEPTSEIVERTASILKKYQNKLSVRCTVLPENYQKMPEIAAYFSETLQADEIHIEPAYSRGDGPSAELADEFCEQYISLKRRLGPRLSFSGSRIREIHGRSCQIFRQVLHLVPPGVCSACFALSSQKEAEQNGLLLKRDQMELVFERLSAEDPACEVCFNRYHCARGCPDVCPALTQEPEDAGSFRCRVSRTLAEAELLDLARGSLADMACQYGYAGVKLRGEL